MKKMVHMAFLLAFVMALALPTMACEVGLDVSTYDQEDYEQDGYSELLKDPNIGAIADEEWIEFFPTGGPYTEGDDGFIPEQEFEEACQAFENEVSGEGIDIIDRIPSIEYGGNPEIQRIWGADKNNW